MPRPFTCLLAPALTLALVLVPRPLHSPPAIAPVSAPASILPLAQPRPEIVESPQHNTTSPERISAPQPSPPAPQPTPQPVVSKPLTNQAKQRPQVAIIIDDMGYNLDIGRQLLQLDLALSFSFLPAAPHTGELARQAQSRGRSILVHLPMEPKTWQGNEEQETLRVGEKEEALQEKLEAMLAAVPAAIGANNHMGSRFTEDRRRMQLVMAQLHPRSMFYIDSFTSAASVGETTARQVGVPTARRTVFLDNQQQAGAICRQLELLAAKATAGDTAIAIGHPHPAMAEALTTCAGERLRDVELVGAEALVR